MGFEVIRFEVFCWVWDTGLPQPATVSGAEMSS